MIMARARMCRARAHLRRILRPMGEFMAEPIATFHAVLRELLLSRPVIAMVGASSKPGRPSHGVMSALLAAGYEVIPVHPRHAEVHGRKVYPDLASIPGQVDLVNVFRRAEWTPEV